MGAGERGKENDLEDKNFDKVNNLENTKKRWKKVCEYNIFL